MSATVVAVTWALLFCSPEKCEVFPNEIPTKIGCELIIEMVLSKTARELQINTIQARDAMERNGYTFECIPSSALSPKGTE